jgi:hypothetical protein
MFFPDVDRLFREMDEVWRPLAVIEGSMNHIPITLTLMLILKFLFFDSSHNNRPFCRPKVEIMPVNCIVPGCTRRSYQSTKVAKCKVHGIKWALDEELAQVVQVFRRDRTVNGVRTKFTEVLPAAVDPLALTAETLHANNTPVRIVQVRSNAGSEWRAVRVSEWPEDLTSSNVRTLLVYSKSSSGDTNFLPPEIVAGASGISNESAATGIDNRKAQRKASDKSLKDRKESGESTKRRVWTQKYSNENPLCIFSGCTSCANANVAGLPCFPHALADEDVVEVEVRDGKLEVTIRVKTDSLFEDEDVTAGMLTTLVFDEIASSVGGIVYNGKRYECTPDAFFLLANACSPVEIERKKVILRTPLSCPEERKDRNDQWTRNMNAQREWDRKKEQQVDLLISFFKALMISTNVRWKPMRRKPAQLDSLRGLRKMTRQFTIKPSQCFRNAMKSLASLLIHVVVHLD